MMSQAELSILIKARNEATAVLNQVKGSVSSLGDKLGSALKIGGLAAAGGLGIATVALYGFIGAAMESQKVAAQTDAVLMSTHGAAGMTADSVNRLANELSRFTPYDDEAIQSAENLLLTFTSIGKDVFPQATETVLNMSTALGQDLKSSAIQLGKAMNDPITGATALRRVGVALTEQQMAQIKAFQESGNLMGAQSIIMKELQTEFGGSARAAGETFAGKLAILKTQLGNVKEAIGLALLPLLMKLADVAIKYVVPAIENGSQALQDFVGTIRAALAGDVGKAGELFNKLPAPLQALALWLSANKTALIDFAQGVGNVVVQVAGAAQAFFAWLQSSGTLANALLGLRTIGDGLREMWALLEPGVQRIAQFFMDNKVAAIALGVALAIAFAPGIVALLALIATIGLVRRHWEEITGTVTGVVASVKAVLSNWGLLDIIQGQFDQIRGYFEIWWAVVSGVFKIALDIIHGDWGAAWDDLRAMVEGVFEGIKLVVTGKLEELRGVIKLAAQFAGLLWDAGVQLIQGLIDGMWSKVEDAVGAVKSIGGKIKDGVTGIFGIKSPSTVFHGYGQMLMEGLSSGIDQNGAAVLAAISKVTDEGEARMAAFWAAVAQMGAAALAELQAAQYTGSVVMDPGGGSHVSPGRSLEQVYGPIGDQSGKGLFKRDPNYNKDPLTPRPAQQSQTTVQNHYHAPVTIVTQGNPASTLKALDMAVG